MLAHNSRLLGGGGIGTLEGVVNGSASLVLKVRKIQPAVFFQQTPVALLSSLKVTSSEIFNRFFLHFSSMM